MTLERWKALAAGDVLIDENMGGREREVFSVRRISGTRGQGNKTRVCLVVTNLKSHLTRTTIFVSDELGLRRFKLKGEP